MIIVQDNGKVNVEVEEYTETLLWSNSSPTSDFASQTVTLSDNISNYDFIKIDWEYAKTVTDKKSSIIIPVVDFIKSGGASNTYTHYFIGYVGTITAVRCVSYVSDNQIAFSGDMRVNAAASYSNTDIPLKVVGLKKERREAGNRKVKTGFLSSIPSDGFINCGFDPKHVIVVSKYDGNNTNAVVYDEDDSATTYRQYFSNTTVQNESVAIGTTDRAGFDSVGNGTNGFTLNHSYTSYFTNVRYIATD